MASSLFGNRQNPQGNNIANMITQFAQFRRQMSGQNPQAIVQNLLTSGQMSREQYQQLSEMAKSLQSILK